MINQIKINILLLPLLGILVQPVHMLAQAEPAPPNLAAALTVKMAAFEKNISSGGDVTIFVLGAPEVAEELQSVIGSAIGKATLTTVVSGDTLPEQAPSLLFVGQQADVDQAITYARIHRILNITGTLDLVDQGITLGIGIGKDGKPAIKLNLTSTIEKGISWNPAIMKIAKTVK